MFVRAFQAAIALDVEYVPAHETGGILYCCPLVVGSGPIFIPGKPDEYTFAVFAIPTWSGADSLQVSPMGGLVFDNFDRAAPKGIGNAKPGETILVRY